MKKQQSRIHRNSRSELLCKKGTPKELESLFNKVATLPFKRKTPSHRFSVNFNKLLRTPLGNCFCTQNTFKMQPFNFFAKV